MNFPAAYAVLRKSMQYGAVFLILQRQNLAELIYRREWEPDVNRIGFPFPKKEYAPNVRVSCKQNIPWKGFLNIKGDDVIRQRQPAWYLNEGRVRRQCILLRFQKRSSINFVTVVEERSGLGSGRHEKHSGWEFLGVSASTRFCKSTFPYFTLFIVWFINSLNIAKSAFACVSVNIF